MNCLDEFERNCNRSLLTVGTGRNVDAISHGAIPTDDIARAAVVLSVAAFDTLVHRLVFDLAWVEYEANPGGIFDSDVATWLGIRSGSPAFLGLDQGCLEFQLAFRSQLATKLYKRTLQNPAKVSEALSKCGIADLWSTSRWKPYEEEIVNPKETLGAIVDRRNRIAHQCDIDMVSGEISPLPLSLDDARLVVDQLKLIGIAVASFACDA